MLTLYIKRFNLSREINRNHLLWRIEEIYIRSYILERDGRDDGYFIYSIFYLGGGGLSRKWMISSLFIHFEKSETELTSILENATQILNTPSIREAKFENSAILDLVENVGKLELTRTNQIEMNEYVKHIFPSNCLLLKTTRPQICFRNITLKHNTAICLGDSMFMEVPLYPMKWL